MSQQITNELASYRSSEGVQSPSLSLLCPDLKPQFGVGGVEAVSANTSLQEQTLIGGQDIWSLSMLLEKMGRQRGPRKRKYVIWS